MVGVCVREKDISQRVALMSYECHCTDEALCKYHLLLIKGSFYTEEEIKEPKIKRVRPNNNQTNRPVAQCGTRAGYNKHRREKTSACAECKQAQSDYVNDYLKRKRAS